ncbi:MAG: Gfo/Idh/MocA family oxidoreductase [Acidobacteriia bacterium]|nr:Gfo/Idh/MocA family oxidoreductase [Terriglobia bacterium]
MNRRTFAMAAATALGAADRVRVGLIGAGGRGRFLTGEFKEVGLEVAGVCDVYEPNLAAGLQAASTGARSFNNYKRLLEDRSLDAVVVATPDHWHARMVIDAVEAGKDVYVEKPLAHTVQEGFDIIAAVRRTKRIVQVGTQRRSAELFLRAKELAAPARLGDVRLVTSYWLNNTAALSQKKLAGNLDWDQWLGTSPKSPVSDFRFFNWYYFWDYSGGLLIGQAAHIVDAIMWFMGSKEPVAVTCTGGRVNLTGGEVPETATIAIEFPDNYLATFTLGYKAMRYNAANDQLMQFHGSKARLDVGRESYALYPESSALEMKPAVQESLPGSFGSAARAHIRNFLECIRSRKEPNAPVEAGHATNIVLVMAMASLRAGRRLRWDAAHRQVV